MQKPNELIEKIEVFQAEKVNGVWQQRITIHYNCIGSIEIPELLPIPATEVSMDTRKGVKVNFVLGRTAERIAAHRITIKGFSSPLTEV